VEVIFEYFKTFFVLKGRPQKSLFLKGVQFETLSVADFGCFWKMYSQVQDKQLSRLRLKNIKNDVSEVE